MDYVKTIMVPGLIFGDLKSGAEESFALSKELKKMG